MVGIFLFSCAWKYSFAFLASMHRSRSVFSLDGSRSIYDMLEVQFPAQLMYFCAGILLLLYFDKLKFHFRSIAIITASLFLLDHFFAKGLLDVLWIAGLVFAFGFWRYIGNFAKFGDFSYGVYIVHFPIVQTMISFGLATNLNPVLFVLLDLFFVSLASVLMWHLVEKRFLAGSSHYRQGSPKATG